MGQIIFDEYLTNRGLTEENCRAALNLSDSDLGEHTLIIKVFKEPKKHGLFHSVQIFLDDKPEGVTIGISGYKESFIKETIAQFSKSKGLRGIWPKKKQPFLQWFKKNQRKPKLSVLYRKHYLLPISLQLVKNFQTKMPKWHMLKTAYNVFQQYHSKKYKKLENKLYAMIAYREADWAARAVAATEVNNHISLWDNKKNIILKMDSTGNQMEYQSIIFSLEDISDVYNQVEAFNAKMAQKIVELQITDLLAQNRLHVRIKALQQQAEQQWDKLSLLSAIDLKFLEGYNHPRFNFYKELKTNIQTQAQMEGWIAAWIGRVENMIATPSRVDAATQTILKLIANSAKYGIKTYAMWLGNSNASTLLGKRLNQKCRYALKNSYTIAAIVAKIETLIDYQWLKITTIGRQELPVLVVTDTGQKLLQLLEQKKIKVTPAEPATVVFQAAKTVDVHSHLHWLKEIQHKKQTAYVSFLNTPQSVANIANWTDDEVAQMQRTLNEQLKGWQVLAQWKLSKHPIKYKPLQRLLYT
jgi:hypothetical protein